jgi:chemotaxis protein MotB
MGGEAMDAEGAKRAGAALDERKDFTVDQDASFSAQTPAAGGKDGQEESRYQSVNASKIELTSKQDQLFHSAAASIRQAWQAMPDVTEISDNLLVEETVDGLDIQLIDQKGRRMFPEGSKYPLEPTREAIAAIAPILQKLPNQIRISGHIAAGTRFDDPRYGPWELSSDRANVVRQILGEFGLSDDRISAVVGKAASEPYFPNDPYLSANERIMITVLYEAPPVPAEMAP